MIDISIKDQDIDQIYLHMQNLNVEKFQIFYGKMLYDGISKEDD